MNRTMEDAVCKAQGNARSLPLISAMCSEQCAHQVEFESRSMRESEKEKRLPTCEGGWFVQARTKSRNIVFLKVRNKAITFYAFAES